MAITLLKSCFKENEAFYLVASKSSENQQSIYRYFNNISAVYRDCAEKDYPFLASD